MPERIGVVDVSTASNERGQSDSKRVGLPGMRVPEEITTEVLTAVGRVWARATLSHRDRSLITIAALVADRCEEALHVHIRRGRENGLTRDDVYEAILHIGLYAGLGVAMDAFRIADQVFSEESEEADL